MSAIVEYCSTTDKTYYILWRNYEFIRYGRPQGSSLIRVLGTMRSSSWRFYLELWRFFDSQVAQCKCVFTGYILGAGFCDFDIWVTFVLYNYTNTTLMKQRIMSHQITPSLLVAHWPKSFLVKPSSFGKMSCSKIPRGNAKVTQALGESTTAPT